MPRALSSPRSRGPSRSRSCARATSKGLPIRSPAARKLPKRWVDGGRFAKRRSVTVCTYSLNRCKIAVPAEAVLEACRACNAVLQQRFASVVPLLNKPLAHREPMALDGGAPVCAHTDLRETRDFVRELLGFFSGAPFRGEIFA